MSSTENEVFSALALLTGNPNAGAVRGEEGLRATGGWNRLNKAISVTLPRNVNRAEAARLRIARMR